MERKFYTDDFEQLLREQSDEFRMYPSKRVWHSIYNDLHPGRKWPSVAVSMFLIIALLTMGYWNSNSSDATKNSKTISIASAKLKAVANAEGKTEGEKYMASSLAGNNSNEPGNIIVEGKKAVSAATSSTRINAVAAIRNNIPKNTDRNNTNNTPAAKPVNEQDGLVVSDQQTYIGVIAPPMAEAIEIATIPAITQGNNDVNLLADQNNNVVVAKPTSATTKSKTTIMSAADKAWMEDFAFHNKSRRKPWKDRTTLDFYLTPNVTYRKLNNDSKYNLPSAANSFSGTVASMSASDAVDQRPGLGLEAGLGITYSVGKNFRIKAGMQANYTNYGVNADETNHPVLTTLMFADPNTGYTYLSTSSSTLSNSSGLQPVKMHNKTYQFSVPLGMALKITGNDNLEFYAGASLQPTLVLGGKANLISADRKNYVADPSLIRRWNLNTGFETYINYKLDGFTLQAGPQFRYQLFSTYDKKYTVNENLYSMGIKVGILKNF